MDAVSANSVSHYSSTVKVVMLNYTETQEGVWGGLVWGWELSACYTARRTPSWELSACFDSWHCEMSARTCHQETEREEGSGEKRGGGEENGKRESKRDARGRDKTRWKKEKTPPYTLWLTYQRANGDLIITDFIWKMTNASAESSVAKSTLIPLTLVC